MEEEIKEGKYSHCWKQIHERLSDYKNKEKILKDKFPNISDEEIRNRIGRSSESPMCLSNPFWDLSNEEYESITKSFNESWNKAVKEYFEKEKLKLETNNKKKMKDLLLGLEPAFPCEVSFEDGQLMQAHQNGNTTALDNGMTKRFYAACVITQGLCVGGASEKWIEATVKRAYQIADELLKQENEKPI